MRTKGMVARMKIIVGHKRGPLEPAPGVGLFKISKEQMCMLLFFYYAIQNKHTLA